MERQSAPFGIHMTIAESELRDVTMRDEDGKIAHYSYRDVWRFRTGKMVELRTFVIKTEVGGSVQSLGNGTCLTARHAEPGAVPDGWSKLRRKSIRSLRSVTNEYQGTIPQQPRIPAPYTRVYYETCPISTDFWQTRPSNSCSGEPDSVSQLSRCETSPARS